MSACSALTGWRLMATPTGFIPEQDQGFLIGVVQLPPGASLERTEAVLNRAREIAARHRRRRRIGAAFAGLDGASFSPGVQRRRPSSSRLADCDGARRRAVGDRAGGPDHRRDRRAGSRTPTSSSSPPPAVQGLGNGNGFTMMVQDRSGAGYRALEGVTGADDGRRRAGPAASPRSSPCSTPARRASRADVDRDRAQMLGVQPSQVFDALGTYLGSTYVNDFNLLGRTFRVTAQAEPAARDDLADIGKLQVRSASGAMVPLASVATLEQRQRARRGWCATTCSPRSSCRARRRPASPRARPVGDGGAGRAQTLPQGFSYEWTGLAFQEKAAGGDRGVDLPAGGGVRLPRAGRPVRGADAAAGGDPDRADVHPRRDGSASTSAGRTTTS